MHFEKSKKCFVCVSFLHGEGDGEQSRVQLNGILRVGTKKQKKKLTCKTQTNTFKNHKNTLEIIKKINCTVNENSFTRGLRENLAGRSNIFY